MQSSQGKTGKKFWGDEEDAALVQSILALCDEGRYFMNGTFKPGHLKELEKLMETKKPGCGIKGKPHIESRLKTLKTHFQCVHDMVSGVNCSGFGWDPEKKFVVAENAVWEAYIQSHKGAAYFRHRSFPYYEDLCTVYAKDRATGSRAETFVDAVDDMERTSHDNYVEEENFANDDMGNENDSNSMFSRTQQDQPASSDGSSKKRKRMKKVDDHLGDSIKEASENLGVRLIESISSMGQVFGRQEIIEKQKKLNEELIRTTTLSRMERIDATELIGPNISRLNVFFSLSDEDKDAYVRAILSRSA